MTPEAAEHQQSIFLSFRRVDTLTQAFALSDSLSRRLPGGVFFDFAINPADWVGELIEIVRKSALLLLLIGPKWLDVLAERRDRGDVFSDFVYVELRAAFENRVPLLIVLVDDTLPPAPSLLPPELSQLVDVPSVPLRTAYWEQDVAGIIDSIGRHRRW